IKIIVFTSSVHNHSFKIAAVLDKQVTNRHVNIFLTTMAQSLYVHLHESDVHQDNAAKK
ncbi:unnamed protein product, partial [Rotaria magnacalcarata]